MSGTLCSRVLLFNTLFRSARSTFELEVPEQFAFLLYLSTLFLASTTDQGGQRSRNCLVSFFLESYQTRGRNGESLTAQIAPTQEILCRPMGWVRHPILVDRPSMYCYSTYSSLASTNPPGLQILIERRPHKQGSTRMDVPDEHAGQ